MIQDPHPLVRAAACDALLGASELGPGLDALGKALDDPLRLVRTAAARNLLQVPVEQHPPSIAPKLRLASDELAAGLLNDADRAGAHLSLAVMAEQQGRLQSAIGHYRDAIRVEPGVTGARTNLAALLERNLGQSNNAAASTVMEEIKELRAAELKLLARDVKLLPSAASLQYRYGLALYVNGQKEESLKALMQAAELEPNSYEYVQAVTLMHKSNKNWSEAQAWCDRLLKLAPPSMLPSVQAIEKEIEAQVP